MPGPWPTWIKDWWRSLRRPATARPLALEPPSFARPPGQKPSDRTRTRGEIAPPPASEQSEALHPLATALGLAARPRPLQADPAAGAARRARTLEALANLRQIPALQALAQDFLQAMSRDEVSLDEIVATVRKDSALTVRVLRMANSVLVSPERRIEELETAVQMLGIARVRQTAQALLMLRGGSRVAEGFDWHHLWVHALATAAIAEELEQQLRGAADSPVYLAGLLHDVGKIVLSTVAPDEYRAVLILAWHESGDLETLERERLGVDHREAGVCFARHMHLPEAVIQVIAHHDQPEAAAAHAFEVAVVALANQLSKAHGLGFSGSRAGGGDEELSTTRGWRALERLSGRMPPVDAFEDEMGRFVQVLRQDLRGLREAARAA